MQGVLVLADGRTFKGRLFGAKEEATGEVVFNTSMAGYQEVITDPSYAGQMVVMTYPLIGNYGISPEDNESEKPWLTGFIIKELSGISSNWRSRESLDEFLNRHNVVGFQGLDTRALTRHIRDEGAQQAIISPHIDQLDDLKKRAQNLPSMEGQDFAKVVTCQEPYEWTVGEWNLQNGFSNPNPDTKWNVVAYDFGIKRNILRCLVSAGCRVQVVPANFSADEVMKLKPDGVFLSNGPGDPAAVTYAIKNVRKLIGKVPIFGICLGHQILSLALGAKTFKLVFGHHGGNQPVMDKDSQQVEITSQNHGFAVAPDSEGDFDIISINLNDQTVEGLRHKTHPIFSVQYHPEASPGPMDSSHLFSRFVNLMETTHGRR